MTADGYGEDNSCYFSTQFLECQSFHKLPQSNNSNIANFVLVLPLKINWSNKVILIRSVISSFTFANFSTCK